MPSERMSSDDLIRDEPLGQATKGVVDESEDTLQHRAVAKRIAELTLATNGNQNIALFGPWGSGKSSLFWLMRDHMRQLDPSVEVVRFDAWENAGEGFQTNFLSVLSSQLPGDTDDISRSLFKSETRVELSRTQGIWKRWWVLPAVAAGVLFVVGPLAYTFGKLQLQGQGIKSKFVPEYLSTIDTFLASSLALFVLGLVASLAIELGRVTATSATPSHTSQFRELFAKVLTASPAKKFVVFIDELDRCGPKDVMHTLEGLRTFLNNDACVFVVAFDRAAVSSIIASELHRGAQGPSRDPYYSLAGEYLDKIFQFQTNLPPQTPHTFRKYAYDLVAKRGGVWGDVSSLGAIQLQRVVKILAPIHLSSPRRAKVLLNDFAVRARVYEEMGFEWPARCEEIAVLSTISVEFPHLAEALESSPTLLQKLVSRERPTSDSSRLAYDRFLGPHNSQGALDTVIGTPASGAAPADTEGPELVAPVPRTTDGVVSDADQIGIRHLAQLDRYLGVLRDMRATVPRADILLSHSSEKLVAFEEIDVYNAVLLASDAPIKETAATIAAASLRDQIQAIDFFVDELEHATQIDSQAYVELVGGIAADMPLGDLRGAGQGVVQAWLCSAQWRVSDLGQMSLRAKTGYATALVIHGDGPLVQEALETLGTQSQHDFGLVLDALATRIDDAALKPHYPTVLHHAIELASDDSRVLGALLARGLGPDRLPDETGEVARLAQLFGVDEPTYEAEAGTAVVLGTIMTRNADLKTEYEKALAAASLRFEPLVQGALQNTADTFARRLVASVLVKIADECDWPDDVLARVVAQARASGASDDADFAVLTALAAYGTNLGADWIPEMGDLRAQSLALVNGAIETLANEFTELSDLATLARTAEAISQLADKGSSMGLDWHPVLNAVDCLIDRGWEVDARMALSASTSLLQTLRELGADQDEISLRAASTVSAAIADPEGRAMSGELRTAVSTFALADLVAVAGDLARDVAATLEAPDERLADSLAVYVYVQSRLVIAGHEQAPVSVDLISRALVGSTVGSEILADWLTCAPRTEEAIELLRRGEHLPAIDSQHWLRYSQGLTPKDRSHLWDAAREARLSTDAVKQIAAPGVPRATYDTLVSRTVAALTLGAETPRVDELMTLPQGNKESAAAAVRLATQLAGTGRRKKGSLGNVSRVLLANVSVFSNAQRAQVRAVLDPWLRDAPGAVTRGDLSALNQARLATADRVLTRIKRRLSGGR